MAVEIITVKAAVSLTLVVGSVAVDRGAGTYRANVVISGRRQSVLEATTKELGAFAHFVVPKVYSETLKSSN